MAKIPGERSNITNCLEHALSTLLDLQSYARKSRYVALYSDREQGEVIGAEPTFNDILEKPGFGVSEDPEDHAPRDSGLITALDLPQKQLAKILKDLQNYPVTDRDVASMFSDSPRLKRYLQMTFEYIANQRTTWHELAAQFRDREKKAIELESKLSNLAERYRNLEELREKNTQEIRERVKERLKNQNQTSTVDLPSSSSCATTGTCPDTRLDFNFGLDELWTVGDTARELELLKVRFETFKGWHEEDDEKLSNAERLAEECRKSFENAVRAVVWGHENFPDFDGLQEDLRLKMIQGGESLAARCLRNIEKVEGMNITGDTDTDIVDTKVI